MKTKIYPFRNGQGVYPTGSQIFKNEIYESHIVSIEFNVDAIIGKDPTREDLNIDRETMLKILKRVTEDIVEIQYSESK
jgi:hypothetical protein